MANQKRNYCLTINNPIQEDEEFSIYLKSLDHLKYFIFQREKGEETGTIHIQLYIEFSLGKRFEQMKKLFPTAHIEERRGTKEKARDYCCKEDTRIGNVYEYGEFAEERERTDLTDIIQMIESGFSNYEITKAYPHQSALYSRFIDNHRQEYLKEKYSKVKRDIEVIYIYGSAGTGKTRFVMDKYGYEKVYRVTNYDKSAFDNYCGQDVVVFEEFRSSFTIQDMLNYLDIYPVMLPARYVNKVACYTKVYILTNIPLLEQYQTIQKEHLETWKAFERRIHIVKCFDQKAKQTLMDLQPCNEELPF